MSQIKITREGILLILTVAGVAVTAINFLILNQLAPVISSIQSVSGRVAAVEKTLSDRTVIVERYIATEQQVKDIRDSQIRMENKIDQLLQR